MNGKGIVCLPIAAGSLMCAPVIADINVEFRPSLQTVSVGDPIDIGLYVVSDTPGADQDLSALQVIVSWDTAFVQLTGNDDTGGASLIQSGFPTGEGHGLNESSPPTDGDGMYIGLGSFGSPIMASPAGTLITTLQFQALAETPLTPIDILAQAGSPPGDTVVFDGTTPNLDVTGTLSGAGVEIIPTPGFTGLAIPAVGLFAARRRR